MVISRAHNSWVPFVTFLMAFMLSAFPIPAWVQWGWPEWVLVVFIYWVIALPNRFGLGWAFILGLLLDLLQGSHLGVNAFAMVVVTFFAMLMYRRLRMYRLWQQAFIVVFLVAINQCVSYGLQGIGSNVSGGIWFLLPAVTSGLLWLWLFVVLRGIRRAFKVT
ncbi:MAG: rod shape-determining protein MreD [Gammaproteobacteria bacterium]|nr:rod shape-determining protein MreD [Gammaproteobacteria bacterium]